MKTYFCILGLCVLGQGCTFLGSAARNSINEPWEFADNLAVCARNHLLACEAWTDVVKTHPDHDFSTHYARGFKEGFVDYLQEGGTGEPPPLPPKRYWRICYKNPEGHQAAEDWFAGFRHGAAVARQSGYREWMIVPTSTTLEGDTPPFPSPQDRPLGLEDSVGPEDLPLPKKVPAPEELPPPKDAPAREGIPGPTAKVGSTGTGEDAHAWGEGRILAVRWLTPPGSPSTQRRIGVALKNPAVVPPSGELKPPAARTPEAFLCTIAASHRLPADLGPYPGANAPPASPSPAEGKSK